MVRSRPLSWSSLALAWALAAAPPGALGAHDLTGTVVLLARGGKLQDRTAEPGNAVVIFRP
jgi:hypothetical protein